MTRDQQRSVSIFLNINKRIHTVNFITFFFLFQSTIGAVPYLGIYFSDLTYIDSAYPKTITVENDDPSLAKKLINFEKHRKEYEVLAQIKLFQSAANAYSTLHPIPRFKAWFDNVRIYTDAER